MKLRERLDRKWSGVKGGIETEILVSKTVVGEEIGCVRKTNDTIYTKR